MRRGALHDAAPRRGDARAMSIGARIFAPLDRFLVRGVMSVSMRDDTDAAKRRISRPA